LSSGLYGSIAATVQQRLRPDMRLFAVFLAGICAFIDLYATQSLLPVLKRDFRADEVAVSLTVGAATIAVAIAAPLVGALADRIGRKNVIVACILLLSAPTALAAAAPDLRTLVTMRFLQGLFMPGIFAVTMAYIGEEWFSGGAGHAMSCYVAGSVLGGFLGRFISGLVTEYWSWRAAFVVLALVNLASGLLISYFLPKSRNFVPSKKGSSLGGFGRHLTNRKLVATFAAGFNVLFALVATFTYSSYRLGGEPYNLSPQQLAYLFLIYLVGVVVTPYGGRAIDRFGHGPTLAGGVAVSCTGALLTMFQPLWVIVLGLTLCSSGIFICQASATTYVGAVAGYARSSASGLYVTFYYIGGSLGAVLPGFLWRSSGWTGVAALVIVVEVAMAAVALAFWTNA
jgi:predicted MFS family arabinose efflux permease